VTSRYPAIAADIAKLFAARNTHAVEVAVLQPADPFLDMAGEDLRRRIFLTESETGATLCLRPEFTIPVCLDHIASQAGTPRRYSYLGEVFRQRREGGNEFFQAGIEDLGDRDTPRADACSVAGAHALLSLTLPGVPLAITLGDQSVFEAVLAALGLPRGWRMRLARAFGSAEQLAAALADLNNPPKNGALPEPVAALVADGDLDRLAEHISADMAEAGLSPTAGRTPQEISRRLVEKAELRSVRLSAEAFTALPPPLRSKPSPNPLACRSARRLPISPPASRRFPPKGSTPSPFATTPPSAVRSTTTPASSSRFRPAPILPKQPPARWSAAAATTACSRCSAPRRRSPASASPSGSTASKL
jgi:ATP phosphoribosyltransferase regulatory subunit